MFTIITFGGECHGARGEKEKERAEKERRREGRKKKGSAGAAAVQPQERRRKAQREQMRAAAPLGRRGILARTCSSQRNPSRQVGIPEYLNSHRDALQWPRGYEQTSDTAQACPPFRAPLFDQADDSVSAPCTSDGCFVILSCGSWESGAAFCFRVVGGAGSDERAAAGDVYAAGGEE